MTYVVVKFGVRDGDEVGSMSNVKKAIVKILVASDAVV